MQMSPESPTEMQAVTTQSSVDRDREVARRKEQERRRREAVSSLIRVLAFDCSGIVNKAF